MSDTEPATPDIDGVDVEYVDPEPDETAGGGDAVQLVATGWVRFVIAGHGRVRFRPARVGELKALLLAHEEMLEQIEAQSEVTQAEAEQIDLVNDAIQNDPDSSQRAKIDARRKATAEARRATARLARVAEDARQAWWDAAHKTLGVSGESMPSHDDAPVWLLQPSLMSAVIGHWRSVPLDRGRTPKQQ